MPAPPTSAILFGTVQVVTALTLSLKLPFRYVFWHWFHCKDNQFTCLDALQEAIAILNSRPPI